MAQKKIGCLGILGILLLIGLLMNLFGKGEKKSDLPDTTEKPKLSEKTQTSQSEVDKKEQDPFDALSPSEHLRIARDEIDKYDFKKGKLGNLSEAKRHLAAIPESSIEFKEVKKLDHKINKIEKDIDHQSKILAEKILKVKRKEFADRLETEYLKAGMDIHVTVSGNNYEILKFKWVLFSRPLVFQLINKVDFFSSLDRLEFRKLIITDGYRYTWRFNKTKDGWN